jgi:hypothetical protein
MSSVIRPLGATGYLQQLIWDQGNGVPFRAYLFGGGGGGGGWDVIRGGNGQGGGYATYDGVINAGDVLQVAVGGGGGAGADFTTGSGAGTAGASYVYEALVPTVATVQQIPNVPGPTPAAGTPGYIGDGFFTVTDADSNNPVATGIRYWFIIQGGIVTYRSTLRAPSNMTAGVYRGSVRSYSDDYPGGADAVNAFDLNTNALTITSFSGARGGNAGTGGYSGAGGGGGGATVLILNSTILAVAGGGGGGGGSGSGGFVQGDAPGPQPQQSNPITNGQGGQDKQSVGGGGGGGGGGWGGGDGGQTPGGDTSGQAGTGGSSYGLVTATATNRTSAGSISAYWALYGASQAGNGGTGSTTGGGLGSITATPGRAGLAVVEFETYGTWVNDGVWRQAIPYVNDAGIWKEVTTTWINIGGTWTPVWGGQAPNFTGISGNFGIAARPSYQDPDPGDDSDPGDGSDDY